MKSCDQIGIRSCDQLGSEFLGFSFPELAFLTLGAASLLLALMALLIGLLAFVGYRNIKKRATKIAKQRVDQELAQLPDLVKAQVNEIGYSLGAASIDNVVENDDSDDG